MANTFLIYGAYGYTGELIAEEAKKRGHQPILAGRNREPLERLATRLALPFRVVDLGDERGLLEALSGVDCVIHSAGPFSRTAQPMVSACLKSGKHYLDITGEIAVFEACHAQDEAAKRAGVMLLPGVGFDVVPSDCLAAHVKRRLPQARQLTLALSAGGSTSRGTATTMVENLHAGGAVRKDGRIVEVPAGHKTRSFDFGRGPRVAMTIPWGDVSTAYHSTGIPDIEVYAVVPAAVRVLSRLTPLLRPALASGPVQRFLKGRIQAGPPGPTAEQRARGRSTLIAEARDAAGHEVVSRLHAPEGYALTAVTAVLSAEHVLKGEARPGFQTPSRAFGADFVLEAEGVSREDLK
jgi:short subunit dehydrogenase-like uncharacterized protein